MFGVIILLLPLCEVNIQIVNTQAVVFNSGCPPVWREIKTNKNDGTQQKSLTPSKNILILFLNRNIYQDEKSGIGYFPVNLIFIPLY